MITYPFLEKGSVVGVTAPSSGVEEHLHSLLQASITRLEKEGYRVKVCESAWSQTKARSTAAKTRANELHALMADEEVQLIFPPWGGELLIEMLEHIHFQKLQTKWVLGYSDVSALLLTITLNTGIATAHGTNLIDIRGEYSDETTAMWQSILATKRDQSIVQHSSKKYQKEWQFDKPTSHVFHLTEPTAWKSVHEQPVKIQGRLLGGCIDIIRHLIGTPYGNVQAFQRDFIANEPILWYFENCELNTADMRRSLVQIKLAGWFKNSAGIMFGRSAANAPVKGYTAEDVYAELAEELQLPIIYDIDCGHVPPQITLINGASAVVECKDGQGIVTQTFK